MRKCDHCQKVEEELKPYGGPGDPCNGDFTGLKLVQTYASLYEGPDIQEHETILTEYKHFPETQSDNIKELEEKYGVKEVGNAFFYDQLKCTVGKVALCRDCIVR